MKSLRCLVTFAVAAMVLGAMHEGAVARAAEPESDTPAPQIRAIPPGLAAQVHRFDVATQAEVLDGRGAALGEVVYSNAPPPDVYLSIGMADILVTDDLTTVAVNGCPVAAYEFTVHGDGDGTGPGFTVSFDLYDGCPNNGGTAIAGAGGSLALDHDGLHTVLVDLSAAPVALGASYWLGVSVDSGDAGWVVGTPAQTGYTRNIYDFPFNPCTASFAGSDLYAGFSARVYCEPPFEREFPAYSNTDLSEPGPTVYSGDWIMDDVELIGHACRLSSYEIGAIANGGGELVTITADLRRECEPASVIDGTQGMSQFLRDGSPSLARFDFPTGVDLGDGNAFWVAFQFDGPAQAMISGRAEVGFTDDFFAMTDFAQTCRLFSFGGSPYAGFAIRINCLGDPPIGACCLHEPGEVCRDVPPSECGEPGSEWLFGTACDPDPFDPPCGAYACCLPGPTPYGSCENLSPDECIARGGVPDGDVLCGAPRQECNWWVCRAAEGDCCISRDTLGCSNPDCCNETCDADPWCCEVAWDDVCVERARFLCNWSCSTSQFEWIDPPAGTIDARQPHPPDAPDEPQGISSVTVAAHEHSGACCWTVCEDGDGYPPNGIHAITSNGDGTYRVELARPITPGEWTTLAYGSYTHQTASFGALPGDANGDRVVDPSDIIAIVDQINGVIELPFGMYGCDMDRDGTCATPDIVRLIDLLNGADEGSPWMDATLTESGPSCP